MTEPIKDGGPAFPCDPFIASKPGNETVAKRLAEGMSLRDALIIAAVQGDLAGSAGERRPTPDEVAKFAIEVADAVLKHRGGI